MDRDEATLLDIYKACSLVLAFTADMSKDSFKADLKTQSAVLHQLTIIGEAVKRLSRHCRERHTAIQWSLIAGMRDHLIHGCDAVDLNEVWITATRDVPALLSAVEPLLPPDSSQR